jgi:hypothetical protein
MSDSRRNKDFFRLRMLSKRMSALLPSIASLDELPVQSFERTSREYQALEVEFDRIWAKYGFKSMVMDRRRRCSTRRGNQQFQRAVSRSAKRSEKDKLRLALIRELSQ